MIYQVYYSTSAEKYLLRLTRSKANSILKRIIFIATDPFKQDNNITKLSGTISSYRARVGDIRIIYELDTKYHKTFVVKIAPRGSVYS